MCECVCGLTALAGFCPFAVCVQPGDAYSALYGWLLYAEVLGLSTRVLLCARAGLCGVWLHIDRGSECIHKVGLFLCAVFYVGSICGLRCVCFAHSCDPSAIGSWCGGALASY